MKRSAVFLAILTLSFTLLLGCDRVARELARAALVEPVPKLVVVEANPDEAKSFSAALLEASKRGSARDIDALIDWPSLVRRGAEGLRAGDAVLEEMAKGASRGAVERGVPAILARVSAGESRLDALGAHKQRGETWHVFRRLATAGGFEHIAFRLSKGADRKVRAVDMEMLTAGEPVSLTIRRALVPMLANNNDAVVSRLSGKEQLFFKHAKDLIAAQRATAERRFPAALEVLNHLPRELQTDKSVLLMRIEASAGIGENEHLEAIQALAKVFPQDPMTGVQMIDGYTMTKQYDAALEAVSRTERGSAPDPYFDITRANLLLLAKRPREASEAAKRALSKDATLIDGHWVLVNAALANREFGEVTRLLLDMRQRFNLSYALEQVPEYADYVASPEYERLKQAL